jgi:hypothetical protein
VTIGGQICEGRSCTIHSAGTLPGGSAPRHRGPLFVDNASTSDASRSDEAVEDFPYFPDAAQSRAPTGPGPDAAAGGISLVVSPRSLAQKV